MTADLAELELHLAAHTGNVQAVIYLLKAGADPNFTLKRNLYPEEVRKKFKVDLWTPLHCAVDVRNEKIVRLLIDHQANVNAEDEYGRTPLNVAASRDDVQIIKLLLDSGAYVDSSKSDSTGDRKWRIREPLHSAVESNNFAIVKMLLENNANVNLEDGWNRTPLLLSILEGNSELVEILLEYGADIERSVGLVEKKSNKNALHLVTEKLQVKIIKLLSTKFYLKFNEIQKILKLCFYRNYEDINYLNKDKFKDVIDIIKEHDKILRILLKYIVDRNASDNGGCTALHSACREGNWKIAKTLLENGAETDVQNKYGKTPLHLALFHKHRAIVEILLDYEANLLISDNEGLTPLNYHCQFCPDFDLETYMVKIETLKMTEIEYMTSDVLSYFERQCHDEIFTLKSDHFQFGKFSYALYDIFMDESLEKLIRLSKNLKFCNEVYSEDFHKKYPIYGDILRARLDKAKWRSELIDRGLEFLSYVLNERFPVFILEKILSYLSNTDIVAFIKVYK